MWKSRTILCVALLVSAIGISPEVSAQSVGLREGMRVRVSTPLNRNAKGVIQSVGTDSLVIFTEPFGAPLRVSRASITRLDISEGRTALEGAKKGALWGGIYGVVSGAVILVSTKDGRVDSGYQENGYTTGELAFENLVGGVGLGALIGGLIKAERWSRIEIGGRVSVARSMVRTGLSVPFPRRF
ncbi:MAG TPA: hypothetical protein VM166_08655 [Gemmatimonadaceae bacterium]|nr:hypothetical protein [Gemmatimonadaceae bacterium]